MILENKAEIWAKRINEMKASGKSQKQWCEENDVKYNTIRSWLSKDSNKDKKNKSRENKAVEDKSSKWLKVNLETQSPKQPISGGIIEINIGKFSVNVPDKFNAETFLNVMKSLLEIC